jgi:hypothetical protein
VSDRTDVEDDGEDEYVPVELDDTVEASLAATARWQETALAVVRTQHAAVASYIIRHHLRAMRLSAEAALRHDGH